VKRQAGVIGGLLLVAVTSSGCIPPDVVGRMDGLDIDTVLFKSPLIVDAVAIGVRDGAILTSVLLSLLALHCGFLFQNPDRGSWVEVGKEYLFGAVTGLLLLGSWKAGGGPFNWIRLIGVSLGTEFRPPSTHVIAVISNFQHKVAELATELTNAKTVGQFAMQAGYRWLEAFAFILQSPVVALFVAVNGYAIFFMKLMAHAAYAHLMAIYWMMGPIVTPFVIWRPTRFIFWGYLKQFTSIALWPFLFALYERAAVAVPYEAWLGVTAWKGDPVAAVNGLMQGEIMFLVLNVMTFFIYLGIPVASYLIVSGGAKPLRGIV
jgi:hypothetical protein